MAKPSQRPQMAKVATKGHKVSVKLACLALQISETCYRYQPKLSQDNALIADWPEERGIDLRFIQRGNPQENAYIDRYNRTVRYDWLSHYLSRKFKRFKTMRLQRIGLSVNTKTNF